ncbi:Cobalt-zinc-cadmium resistance protein CzcA [Phycisphaerae bacterium RAS2]|nr:Cobalt-zinc-cadmium resistance protein CzcA [Phycisphaerae bacterium RAS2]
MCLVLLPKGRLHQQDAPLVRFLKKVYRNILPRIVIHPRRAVGALLIMFVLAACAIPFLAEEFLPSFKETDFLMHWVEKPGTSLDAMQRITVQASRELRSIPGVRNFGAHIGRAEVADEVVGPNFTELWISIDPEVNYDGTIAHIQEVVDGYPGLYRDVLTYLKERIKEVLTGASASIVVRVFGPDLDTLRGKAQEIGAAIKDIKGVADLKVEPQVLVPQIFVAVRPEAAAQFGLTAGAIRRAATAVVKGVKVGEVYDQQVVFDVAVWGAPKVRSELAAIRDLLIDTPGGGHVPLKDVADVSIEATPNEIKREGASRRIDVTCNVRDRDLGSVAKEIENRVRKLTFERGYHPEFLGEYAARVESRNNLLMLSAFALLGIFLLLHMDFQSARLAGLVFVTLPFALIGGVAGALLSGGVLSLGSLVGFVTVLGIAARNGIMLVSHYRHLQEEGMPFGLKLIMQGAEERLSPILMTALCAGLGLLPLVVAGSRPGHEIEHPMAIVILGGLFTSTILNLVLLPALYWSAFRSTASIED